MVSQPAYLKNLKTFARAQLRVSISPKEAVKAVTEESDRGAVILAGSGIEDMLEWAISNKLPGLHGEAAAIESMFGVNGIAGTFSNKIALAYALGLIEKETRREIDLIREMRNACAHARLAISFATPELKEVCKQVVSEVVPDLIDPENPEVLRFCFVLKCTLINRLLAGGDPVSLPDRLRESLRAKGVAV